MSSSVRITLSASLTGDLLLSAIFLLSLQTNPRAFPLISRASSPLVWSMANGEIWKRQRGEMTTARTDLKTEFTIGRAANEAPEVSFIPVCRRFCVLIWRYIVFANAAYYGCHDVTWKRSIIPFKAFLLVLYVPHETLWDRDFRICDTTVPA